MVEREKGGVWMKLKINDIDTEIGFWSFLKCSFLVQLVMAGIFYLGIFLVFFLIGMVVGYGA